MHEPAPQHAAEKDDLRRCPYVLDYDRVVLAVAITFLARHGLRCGFRDFEIKLLAAAWLVPLLSRAIAGATGIRLGLIVPFVPYGFILRRAALDHAVANQPQR